MNKKFIARYAAAAALIAGVSSQATAYRGDDCPVDFFCDLDEDSATTALATDSFGPQLVPFGNPVLSVPQFDPSVYAAQHSTTADKIKLKAVRLTLETTVHSAHVHYDNNNTAVGCNFDWTYIVATGIEANASVGTPAINVQVPMGASADLPIGPSSYDWDLLIDGQGETTNETCLVETANLAPWTGAGSIQFTSVSSAPDDDNSSCGGLVKSYTNTASQYVSVEYFYCYPVDTPEPGNCTCETPSPNYRRPGSMLLFPEFDNREGDVSIITVTNTDCTGGSGGQDVDVEFIYIDKNGCLEFNKTETLTPCDTISILTNYHNPNQEQGYVYAFAKNDDGDPIVWNHLIGSLLVVSGLEAFDYGINPVSFRGIGSGSGIEAADGTLTDLDGDGNRDLDGNEYDAAPDAITIPRFLGQDGDVGAGGPGNFRSQLILIALTGGARFETNVCFLFWNDNEEVFSGEYNFTCWDKPYLDDMSFGFRNSFLQTTDHDPLEIIGAPSRESGWICLQGCQATSDQETILDPSIYAVLVERVGSWGVADLPFECGERYNGSLLPNHQFGDGDPDPQDGDNQ